METQNVREKKEVFMSPVARSTLNPEVVEFAS